MKSCILKPSQIVQAGKGCFTECVAPIFHLARQNIPSTTNLKVYNQERSTF